MGVEKEPLKDQETFDKILATATRKSEDARKSILLFRYTGMHVSVLCDPIYDLHEKDDKDGDTHIDWKRTKEKQKGGKKASYCSILKSKHIDFNVEEYAKSIWKRKRKKSRQYFHALIKDVGYRSGILDLSQMTFRHTLGVDMAQRGISRDIIQQTLNCSDAVLKSYLKYSTTQRKDALKKIDW